MAVIDPATNRVVASYGYAQGLSPRGIVFADGAAWVSAATDDQVLRLELHGDRLAVETLPVGSRPDNLVATADGALWVRELGAKTISRIDPRARRVTDVRVGQSHPD